MADKELERLTDLTLNMLLWATLSKRFFITKSFFLTFNQIIYRTWTLDDFKFKLFYKLFCQTLPKNIMILVCRNLMPNLPSPIKAMSLVCAIQCQIYQNLCLVLLWVHTLFFNNIWSLTKVLLPGLNDSIYVLQLKGGHTFYNWKAAVTFLQTKDGSQMNEVVKIVSDQQTSSKWRIPCKWVHGNYLTKWKFTITHYQTKLALPTSKFLAYQNHNQIEVERINKKPLK